MGVEADALLSAHVVGIVDAASEHVADDGLQGELAIEHLEVRLGHGAGAAREVDVLVGVPSADRERGRRYGVVEGVCRIRCGERERRGVHAPTDEVRGRGSVAERAAAHVGRRLAGDDADLRLRSVRKEEEGKEEHECA